MTTTERLYPFSLEIEAHGRKYQRMATIMARLAELSALDYAFGVSDGRETERQLIFEAIRKQVLERLSTDLFPDDTKLQFEKRNHVAAEVTARLFACARFVASSGGPMINIGEELDVAVGNVNIGKSPYFAFPE